MALLLHVTRYLPGLWASADEEVRPDFTGNRTAGVLGGNRTHDGLAVGLCGLQPQQAAQRDHFAVHRHAVTGR